MKLNMKLNARIMQPIVGLGILSVLASSAPLCKASSAKAIGQQFKPSKTVGISSVFPRGWYITGVRQDTGTDVLITGGQGTDLTSGVQALIYHGPLDQIPANSNSPSFYLFTPSFPDEFVTGALFYGPNSPLYNPSLGAGNITAVGAYSYIDTNLVQYPYQLGMMYEGPLDPSKGPGTWTKLVVPNDGTNIVAYTIAHSTMGDLVVGNFDYVGQEDSGTAFIYDKKAKTYHAFKLGLFSTTAYGIWQNNGPNSTEYTIVGGYSDLVNGGNGYIIDYDARRNRFSHFTRLRVNNVPKLISHIEGISGVSGGYSLAADTAVGAYYAFVPRKNNGDFGHAKWTTIRNDLVDVAFTSANTVIDQSVLGVYITPEYTQGYIATVPAK